MNYSTLTWIFNSAASGHYADDKTVVQDKKKIQLGTGIKEVGCANTGIMQQKGEGKLPFNNIPDGTDAGNVFHKIHSPLLSGRKIFKKGKCTLVFGSKNSHMVKGQTGELVKKIMKQAEEKNCDDIVMTVPFNKKTLTWKTDVKGQAKPLFNIASNVHRICSQKRCCVIIYIKQQAIQ